MKVYYDPEVDVLRIIFSSQAIEESDEDKPGIIIDYDKDGNIVGLELLEASKRVEDPTSVEYAVAGSTWTGLSKPEKKGAALDGSSGAFEN